MKVCYTALLGNYDTLMPPSTNDDWKFICYSDQDINVEGWEIRKLPYTDNPRKVSRMIKIMQPVKCDESLWIDARLQIKGSLTELLAGIRTDIAVLRHPLRKCVYEEAEEVIRLGLDDKIKVLKQIERYGLIHNMEKNLPATGMLYRKGDQVRFNSHWASEVHNYSIRDQISFTWAIKQAKKEFSFIPGNVYDKGNTYFRLHKHNK